MHIKYKITTALLLSIYLFASTATRELIKLPLLAEHYQDHKQENTTQGLISFLFMHYYTEDGTDTDNAEDSRLPFKSTEQTTLITFVSLIPPTYKNILSKPDDAFNKHSFGILPGIFLPSQYIASIWQPPRHC